MKTLQDLIDHFANEPEIQSLLKTNLQGVTVYEPYKRLSELLLAAFKWKDTPEGSEYWRKPYLRLWEEEATTQQP